jgi:transketolase C-terminal domain/subunit
MNAFLASVAVAAASSSLGVRAIEAGDAEAAVIGFALAGLAAVGVARYFVRGVFTPSAAAR